MKQMIKNWNLHCEKLTLASVLAFANPKLHVINTGSPGQGKSRSTVELSRALELPFVHVFSGHITPKGLFELMKEHSDDCIIVDESASELANNEVLTLLRSALYGGTVSWATSDGTDKVEFAGNILMNTNRLPSMMDSKAVQDRCLLTSTQLTVKEVLDKMAGAMAQSCHEQTSMFVPFGTKIASIRANPELPSLQDKERALNILKNYFGNNTFHDYASMRRLEQLSQIITTYKRIFDEEISIEECKMLLPTTKEMSVEAIIKQMLKHEPKAQIAKYLIKEEGISRRTAYRRLQECEVES